MLLFICSRNCFAVSSGGERATPVLGICWKAGKWSASECFLTLALPVFLRLTKRRRERKHTFMQQLTPLHVVGLLATIALIIGIGIYSGRKVKSAADFSSGGSRAGAWIVCGAIMGTLVSGQATIGTAQLAFSFGMSPLISSR